MLLFSVGLMLVFMGSAVTNYSGPTDRPHIMDVSHDDVKENVSVGDCHHGNGSHTDHNHDHEDGGCSVPKHMNNTRDMVNENVLSDLMDGILGFLGLN